MNETQNKVAINLDADGVLTNFGANAEHRMGRPIKGLHETKMWEHLNSLDDFWLTMPLTEDAMVLFDAVKHLNPTILTGCPKGDYERSAEHKKIMLGRYFPGTPVITCLSRDKADHMVNLGDILVDDLRKNCQRWTEAGGVAIQHYSAHSTIHKLKSLGIVD